MIPQEKRDRLHTTIRLGAYSQVKQMLQEEDDECIMLTIAKNEQSRCSLHIAVLRQNEEIVRFLSEHYSTTLNVLDNVNIKTFLCNLKRLNCILKQIIS